MYEKKKKLKYTIDAIELLQLSNLLIFSLGMPEHKPAHN